MKLNEVYRDLIRIVSEAHAQVDVPVESEHFFAALAEEFTGSRDEFLTYVSQNIREWFRCAHLAPSWLQEAEWQFWNGRPMQFVGQIDVPRGAAWFHDDASFYVFYDPETGVTKTIVQVA